MNEFFEITKQGFLSIAVILQTLKDSVIMDEQSQEVYRDQIQDLIDNIKKLEYFMEDAPDINLTRGSNL